MSPARTKKSLRRKVATTFTPDFIAAARASTQTTFEHSDRLPDDDGLVFVTDVDDAPLQAFGRLGSDGRWYVCGYLVAPLDKGATPHPPIPDGAIVLRDESVAEAMIRCGINQRLNAALAGVPDEGFAAFKTRLMASRFREVSQA